MEPGKLSDGMPGCQCIPEQHATLVRISTQTGGQTWSCLTNRLVMPSLRLEHVLTTHSAFVHHCRRTLLLMTLGLVLHIASKRFFLYVS